MKLKSRIRALLSFVLIATILMSVSVVGVCSAQELALSYSYVYENPGYAEGKVTLSGVSSDYGTYYLYWANDTEALDGYSEITKMNLSSSTKTFSFAEFTAIPAGAEKIIAVKSDSEPSTKTVASADAVYTLPESKRFGYDEAEKVYSFQALSDIHIDKQSNVYYTYSDLHFAQALECASNRDVDFVTICGDLINGYESSYVKEWQAYQQIIADSSYCNPVYECSGNHEIKSELTYGLDTFKTGTGLDTTTSAMRDEPYFEITAENGDHFIFMSLELDDSPNQSDEFTTEQMTWLKNLLSEYYGDGNNIFIYEHALISKYGAGDNKDTPYYGGGLDQSYPVVQELVGLLEKYPEVFFLSGHTHLDFKYGYNIDNRDGTTAYTVHIPATTSTTKVVDGSLDYTMSEDSSQGYFVDVYDDCVIFNGTDLTQNTIYPAYTYIIDQSGNDLTENDKEDDVDTDTVTVTVDVSNIVSNPDYVNCYVYTKDDATNSLSIPMTQNSDGTYSADVSSDYTHMYFVFNDSAVGKMGSNEYEVANCKVVIGSEKITYSAPSSWSSVYMYAWSDMNQQFNWPGIKMTKDTSTGDYYAYIPEDTFTNVVFNNGDNGEQTENLDLSAYVTDEVEGSYTIVEKEDPVVVSLLGDADVDGKVTVKDATAVQKSAAEKLTLTNQGSVNADVSGDSLVNITDATYIQKYIAEVITSFTSLTYSSKSVASVGATENDLVGATASTLTTLLSDVKEALEEDYRYASFDMYMALKKVYYNYKDTEVLSMSFAQIDLAYNEVNTALGNFNKLKSANNIITIYFTDNRSWGSAKAYVWDDDGDYLQSWNGQSMTYIEKNSMSQSIYAITLNQSKWKYAVFSNGSSQTVNVTLSSEHKTGYYMGDQSSGKYTVKTYIYS